MSLGFSGTQTLLAKFGTDWLSNKTGKEITISYIDIGLLSGIEIKNIYVEDNNSDTLLYAGDILVDINLFSAAFGNINPSKLVLSDVVVKIKLDKDSVFNFNYLIAAFSTNEPKESETELQEIAIDLNNMPLDIKNCKFLYYSDVDGLYLDVDAGNLSLITDSINIAEMHFASKAIKISDVEVNLACIMCLQRLKYRLK